MKIAQKYGLVFNPKKTQVKALMVKFFRCLYDESGVYLDPEKVDTIHALPTPTNITEFQEFLGMVTYLSPFIPVLSILTAPLHKLLKKDDEFRWDASYQTAFQCVKDAVVSDATLRYFDAHCPITVQVDASQIRLGAALLQDKPITITSKALTEVEHHYANIEHEMLAVVFGVEQFRTYVYGRPFTSDSDHKPLESITKKSLANTPAQLQHMLLCPQVGMIMFLAAVLVRKWPSQIHFPISTPKLAWELHWILPSTMPTCPLSKVKPSYWLLRWMSWPTSSSLDGLMISRMSHVYSFPTSNTMNHSMLKVDLCSMEKPSSSLHQKGRRSLVLCTIYTKALPKHNCLPMVVSSGLVSTRPLRKLFSSVKHAWDLRPRMLLHHSLQCLHLHIPGRYVHWTFSRWVVSITSSLLISIPR